MKQRGAIKTDRKQAYAHQDFGDFLREEKRTFEAVREYNIAVKLVSDKKSKEVLHKKISKLLLSLGQQEAAGVEARLANEQQPSLIEIPPDTYQLQSRCVR